VVISKVQLLHYIRSLKLVKPIALRLKSKLMKLSNFTGVSAMIAWRNVIDVFAEITFLSGK